MSQKKTKPNKKKRTKLDFELEQTELELLVLLETEIQEKIAHAWKTGNLSYKLHAAQKVIYKTIRKLPTSVREAVILCARRFGKSYLICLCAIEDCLKNDNVIVRIIGPEIKQTTNIIVPLIAKITDDAPPDLVKRTKSENKWIIGKSELVLGGFDSSNIESHRGSESYAIYIEETGSSESEQYNYAMRDVLKPQLLHTKGKIIHATTPPKVMSHIFVTDTIPLSQMNNAFFRFTVYDNPLLDAEQIDSAIKDSGGVNSITFRREYMAELIKDETVLIIPEFNQSHVSEPICPDYAWFSTVIDFGGVRDKTVAGLIYYDFNTATNVLFDERVFQPNTPSDKIVEGIRAMERQVPEGLLKSRWADASGQTMVDMFSIHDFPVQLPPKADWQANINQLKVAFQEGRWTVHKRCTFTIMTLESGMFNDNKTDFSRTEALGHCDAIAMLMYANRVIDKNNPYPPKNIHRDYAFKWPEADKPKPWVQKRFGSFKE